MCLAVSFLGAGVHAPTCFPVAFLKTFFDHVCIWQAGGGSQVSTKNLGGVRAQDVGDEARVDHALFSAKQTRVRLEGAAQRRAGAGQTTADDSRRMQRHQHRRVAGHWRRVKRARGRHLLDLRQRLRHLLHGGPRQLLRARPARRGHDDLRIALRYFQVDGVGYCAPCALWASVASGLALNAYC